MTTKPYLLAFAFCVAGMVISGLHLLAALVRIPFWNTAPWSAGLGFFVFLWVCGHGIRVEHKLLERKENGLAKAQEITNAVREWEWKVAKRQADVASGLAGAREAEALARRWDVFKEILFRAIDKAGGASGRKLSGVLGSDAHPRIMDFYTSPAGLCILRDAGGNVGHTWGYKDTGELWCLDDVLALNRAGKLPFPDGEPPEISPLPASAALRKAARKSAKQETTVIDGTAREVGQ